ncbi:trehalose-phosphatase [Heliorestis acidaminivorans]|uniref:Trehalose 6-phosphate phosphatase n=1 Tax=Heliorestis acidaminivorans TaxID=553427 RepID=A0A6I0EVY8_9FIRM|nr:trehalose-phosphatase [Heliorestis acidaminivorans]KAB2951202.1 trehalose-phosphatase [Heliorestis acidaminivorans]
MSQQSVKASLTKPSLTPPLALWKDLNLFETTPLLLMLDYDGTVVPIQDKPELARPSSSLRSTLKALSQQKNLIIAFVSGRDIADLKSLLSLEGIYYVGGHGAEMEDLLGNRYSLTSGASPAGWIDILHQEACYCIGSHEGFLLERKKTSFALHYRLASPSIVPVVLQSYRDKIQRLLEIEKLEMVEGKKVVEVRPARINKGSSVKRFLERYPEYHPLYLGDDRTDEDAFQALHGLGTTVLVSDIPKLTYAEYCLQSPQEVLQFLQILSMRCNDGSNQSPVST